MLDLMNEASLPRRFLAGAGLILIPAALSGLIWPGWLVVDGMLTQQVWLAAAVSGSSLALVTALRR